MNNSRITSKLFILIALICIAVFSLTMLSGCTDDKEETAATEAPSESVGTTEAPEPTETEPSETEPSETEPTETEPSEPIENATVQNDNCADDIFA